MTREELKKEAEEYADSVKCEWENDTYWVDCRDKVTDAYLAGAEPREKQIEIDAEQIRALQKQNGELTDKVRELEAQIEKMKKYIKACWVEENLNDYSSYRTNTSDEFRDLVKEIRNGR